MPNDDLQKQIDDLKKQKEKLDAEKAVLDAQKALDDANNKVAEQTATLKAQKELADGQKALADSLKAVSDNTKKFTDDTAALKAQKELLDAQRALDKAKNPNTALVEALQQQKVKTDAEKDATTSSTEAAITKYIGDVKAGPYSGAVDLKEKAGATEAALLAAKAVNEAAGHIASRAHDNGNKAEFYLFTAKEFPKFQRLRAFRFRKGILLQAFDAASVKEETTTSMLEAAPLAAPALAAAGLDAFAKVLGYFKTDYTVGGIDVKLDESLLVTAVSGALGRLGAAVHLPMIYAPKDQDSALVQLVREMAALARLREIAAAEVKESEATIHTLQQEMEASTDPNEKADKQSTIDTLEPSVEQKKAVIALYDGFATSLTTADSSGSIPLEDLVLEYAIDAALRKNGRVMLLHLESTGGSYMVKKNVWTALGQVPMYHSGGATATFLLLRGVDGQVLDADVIPIHGGFISSKGLRTYLSR